MSNVIIESNIPFSKSMMWRDQKKYYDQKGIAAWNEDVPFYITSNPFIARSYAKMAISFVQDWIGQHPDSRDKTFYMLELGTGTGQFSFLFLKNLLYFQNILKLNDIKFKYVMSDISSKSFEFWGNHAALKPYLEAGILDFCIYDLYKTDEIHLHHSKEIISEKNIENPLMVVANYLFDSIATDVFTISDGKLYESTVSLETDEKNLKEGVPLDWKSVKISYEENLLEKNYYNNEFDPILFDYKNKLIDTHFQFPIASLVALKRLQKISNNRFLLLSSDKGYAKLEEMDQCDYPELDFHGSFSVMVNFHAITELLKKQGGDAVIQSFREHITSGIFSNGFSLKNCLQLTLASEQMINGFSPTDYFIIYEHFISHYQDCSLEVMSSYLNLSNWDPYVFDHISDHLCELAEEGDPDVVSFLAEHMSDIADNFYFFASSEDTLFSIGVFFQNIGRFEEAIHYYEKSLHYFGNCDVVLFNMGICYYSLERRDEAIRYLQLAHEVNSDAKDAKEWIDVILKDKK